MGMGLSAFRPDPANDIFPAGGGEMAGVIAYTTAPDLGPQFRVNSGLNLGMPVMPVVSTTPEGAPDSSEYTGPLNQANFLGEPFAVWLGMVALLAGLAYFSTRPSTLGGANPAYVRIGGYNFLAVGTIAAVFIVLLKIIFNRFRVPGFTQFANAL